MRSSARAYLERRKATGDVHQNRSRRRARLPSRFSALAVAVGDGDDAGLLAVVVIVIRPHRQPRGRHVFLVHQTEWGERRVHRRVARGRDWGMRAGGEHFQRCVSTRTTRSRTHTADARAPMRRHPCARALVPPTVRLGAIRIGFFLHTNSVNGDESDDHKRKVIVTNKTN